MGSKESRATIAKHVGSLVERNLKSVYAFIAKKKKSCFKFVMPLITVVTVKATKSCDYIVKKSSPASSVSQSEKLQLLNSPGPVTLVTI